MRKSLTYKITNYQYLVTEVNYLTKLHIGNSILIVSKKYVILFIEFVSELNKIKFEIYMEKENGRCICDKCFQQEQ